MRLAGRSDTLHQCGVRWRQLLPPFRELRLDQRSTPRARTTVPVVGPRRSPAASSPYQGGLRASGAECRDQHHLVAATRLSGSRAPDRLAAWVAMGDNRGAVVPTTDPVCDVAPSQ